MGSKTGSFTAAAQSGDPVAISGKANLIIDGTFVGTVIAERSFDGGSNWWEHGSYTGKQSLVIEEPALMDSAIWRLRCSAYTSGTINWFLGT